MRLAFTTSRTAVLQLYHRHFLLTNSISRVGSCKALCLKSQIRYTSTIKKVEPLPSPSSHSPSPSPAPLWTEEEFAEMYRGISHNQMLEAIPVGMNPKTLREDIKFDYDSEQDPKKEGVKHSALLVCSANYVRSPMMHGVMSKMLTDIGKRSEWALAGAGCDIDCCATPITSTQFILHREKCPVYAHHKANAVTKKLFKEYEYVIDVQKRQYSRLPENLSQSIWESKRKLLGSFIPQKDRENARDLKEENIIDYGDQSFEVLFDKIYEGCRYFLLGIYPEEAKKIEPRKIKSDDYLPIEHVEFFESRTEEWWTKTGKIRGFSFGK